MSKIFFPDDPTGVLHKLRVPEFDATWAGASPLGNGFCLGSETGQILYTNEAGCSTSAPVGGSASGEAINGVAFSQNWLAVTTRRDINLIGPLVPEMHAPQRVTFFGGGLDVAVAPTSGHFVIPLGPDGIMFVKPGTGEQDAVTVSKADKSGLNFCRAVALQVRGADVIVGAGRRGGIGYADYRDGINGHKLHIVNFPDLDFVDVCSLATAEKPMAVAAAAKDGALVFFDNILTDKAPQTIRFKGVKGTVYRVVSVDGDIFVLTNQGLFGMFQLSTRFFQGRLLHPCDQEILAIPIEAADANIVGKKWLLAVGTESVFRFDLEKMPKSSIGADNGTNGDGWEEPEHVITQPRWEETSFEQNTECVAGAV